MPGTKRNKTLWLRHTATLLAGIALFLAVLYLADWQQIDRLPKVRWLPLSGAVLVTFIITGSITMRWGLIVRRLAGTRVTGWFSLYYFFVASRALGFILPKDISDFGFRMGGLKKQHNYSLAYGGISVALDRFFDALFMLISLLAVLPYWFGWLGPAPAIILFFILQILVFLLFISARTPFFIFIQAIANMLRRVLLKLPYLRKKKLPPIQLPEFSLRHLLTIYGLSLLKLLATVTRFVLFAMSFGLAINPFIIILGTPLAQLSYLFAFTPGGIGILEAGWLGVMALSGINKPEGALFIASQRILTMAIVSTIALIAHAIHSFRKFQTTSS